MKSNETMIPLQARHRTRVFRVSNAVLLASGLASGLIVGAWVLGTTAHAEGASADSAGHRSVGEFVDDAAITARVKSGLVSNDGLSALAIEVETHEGVVQLSGFVDTPDQIDTADEIAERQEGVREVRNDLILKQDTE